LKAGILVAMQQHFHGPDTVVVVFSEVQSVLLGFFVNVNKGATTNEKGPKGSSVMDLSP